MKVSQCGKFMNVSTTKILKGATIGMLEQFAFYKEIRAKNSFDERNTM